MKCLVAGAVFRSPWHLACLRGPHRGSPGSDEGRRGGDQDGAGLAKGDIPFDAAKAKEVLQVYVDASQNCRLCSPMISKTGDDTTASPKIWEDMAGFKARAAKLGADATAAMAGATDQAGFAVGFGRSPRTATPATATYRMKKVWDPAAAGYGARRLER